MKAAEINVLAHICSRLKAETTGISSWSFIELLFIFPVRALMLPPSSQVWNVFRGDTFQSELVFVTPVFGVLGRPSSHHV